MEMSFESLLKDGGWMMDDGGYIILYYIYIIYIYIYIYIYI